MRVLVTRAQNQAEATAQKLAELGCEAVLAPVLEVAPSDEAPPPGRDYDAVLVTSANAVAALSRERERFAATPLLAVGRRTAEALREAGFPDVTDAGGDGLALGNLVRERFPRSARLVHAAGHDRKPEPGRCLAAAGYEFDTWICYRATPASTLPPEAASALRAGQIDATLHYSRRSAEIFSRLARQAGLGGVLAGTPHLCLSPDVALGLRDLVGVTLLIAPRPNESSLLQLLDKAAGGPGSRPPQSRC